MQYKSSYTAYPESLTAIFQHEKQDIDQFCSQTGIICRCKMGFVILKTPTESWALRQSALDDSILLYHRNAKKLSVPQKTIYEQYARYHVQEFHFESICHTLGYIYLHELCSTRQKIPFEQLPQVMQEFLTYTKRRMEKPGRYMRRNKRHAILKQQKRAVKQKEAEQLIALIDELFPNAD